MKKVVVIYKRFERFWHWAQALLIFALALTGFEIHGSFSLMGYECAVKVHIVTGIALVILVAFGAFWFVTTEIWKSYTPTTEGLIDQAMFYMKGIFQHAAHPYKKTVEKKLNPLQRLSYIAFGFLMMPIILITGILYLLVILGYVQMESVEWLSIIHTFFAFAILTFVVAHVYMTTTGHTIFADMKAMFTGREEIEVDDE